MKIMKNTKGFTLIELLIALVVFAVGILGVGAMQLTSITGNSKGRLITEASNVAADQIEKILSRDEGDFVDGDGTNAGVAGLDDFPPNDTDGSEASYGNYQIYWNVAEDYPVSGTRTIRVIVDPPGDVSNISVDVVKSSFWHGVVEEGIMKIIKKTVSDERGFVLIASLMMLTVLMVIGIAATNTTTIELQISGNDKLAKQNFYGAEAAAMECAQRLENEVDTDKLRPSRTPFPWLFDFPASGSSDFVDPAKPFSSISDPWQVSGLDTDIQFGAISNGKVKGKHAASLKMTASAVHSFSLYGQATRGNGQKIIEIGYLKRL